MISGHQGIGKCNQPRPKAEADYTCLDLHYSGYHKNLIQLLFIIVIVMVMVIVVVVVLIIIIINGKGF